MNTLTPVSKKLGAVQVNQLGQSVMCARQGAFNVDLLVITNIRSYHQVDLFDAIASRGDVSLHVIYLLEMTAGRLWKSLPTPKHSHRNLPVWFGGGPLFFNPGLLPEIRRVRPRMAVVCQYVGLSNLVAMLVLTLMRVPWVFWSESPGVRLFEVKSRIPKWLRNVGRQATLFIIGKGAVEVWGVGVRATRQYGALTGLTSRNMPYYSDLAKFSRRDGRAGDNGLRVLFAGRCSYRKGFDTVLEVVRELDRRCPTAKWNLTVCGDGDLLQRVQELPEGARARVSIMGFQELAAMPGVYSECDVLLCPSRYDGWGMVVPEALAAGLVVFTTPETGSGFEIGARSALYLFSPEDVSGIVNELTTLVENPVTLRIRKKEAKAASAPYDAAVGATRFSEYAKDVLNKSRNSRGRFHNEWQSEVSP